MKALILIVLAFGLNQACTSPSKSHCDTQLRAVIDMGSGSTKLNMAEVEVCAGQVHIKNKIDQDNSRAVALEAAKNVQQEIPSDARQAAVQALLDLQEVARRWAAEHKYNEFYLAVVGTHALRTANNRGDFVKQIDAAGFAIRSLSQEEEALAGYHAVLSSPLPEGCRKEDLLVWDVGGGSAQLVRTTAQQPEVIKFQFGAEEIRKDLLRFKKPSPDPLSCPSHPDSPNPVGKKNLGAARALVANKAKALPQNLVSKKTCVIGIGGVHGKAVAAQLQKNWNKIAPCACGAQPNCLPTLGGYSKKELLCLAEDFVTKNDCTPELNGPYAKTSASNLILVLGFMDRLKIERVYTKAINMGDYYLGDPGLAFKAVSTR